MRLATSDTPDRFVLLAPLHLDRTALADLVAWAEPQGLTLENAIQLAVCLFNERRAEWIAPAAPLVAPVPPAPSIAPGPPLSHGP